MSIMQSGLRSLSGGTVRFRRPGEGLTSYAAAIVAGINRMPLKRAANSLRWFSPGPSRVRTGRRGNGIAMAWRGSMPAACQAIY